MIAVSTRNVFVKRIHWAVFSCVCRHMVTFYGPAVGCALRLCAGRALVAPSRQGGEVARLRELKQRRPPVAPALLAAREIARSAPGSRPVKSNPFFWCEPRKRGARLRSPTTTGGHPYGSVSQIACHYTQSTTSIQLMRKSRSCTRPRSSSAAATMDIQLCTYAMVQP